MILLSSDAPLFRRIQNSISEFPFAEIIRRTDGEPGDIIDATAPANRHTDNPVRKAWSSIKEILDRRKISTDPVGFVEHRVSDNNVYINPVNFHSQSSLPMLVSVSHYPRWTRDDGGKVYASTPFFMLTFIRAPTSLVYLRNRSDLIGIGISAVTLILLASSICYRLKKSDHIRG